MRTVVYQSYRSDQVPTWLSSCMRTVREWASESGYEYRLFDDEFFSFAPDWFRQRADHQICPVTDLARLVAAKNFLAQDFDRAIWVDADVVVFAPDKLVVDTSSGFTLCHEVWPYTDPTGRSGVSKRVNNCIAAFQKGTIHLDFLIDACLRIAHNKTKLGKLDVGTAFLTQLRGILPFPLLMNVGSFGPAILADIAVGDGPRLRDYAEALPLPLACANLCASLAGANGTGMAGHERIYEAATSRCIETRGAVVNRLVQAGTR